MEDYADEAGKIGAVGIGWQVAVSHCAREALAQRGLARCAARGQLLADGIGGLAARKRPLHHETSRGSFRIGQ